MVWQLNVYALQLYGMVLVSDDSSVGIGDIDSLVWACPHACEQVPDRGETHIGNQHTTQLYTAWLKERDGDGDERFSRLFIEPHRAEVRLAARFRALELIRPRPVMELIAGKDFEARDAKLLLPLAVEQGQFFINIPIRSGAERTQQEAHLLRSVGLFQTSDLTAQQA
ncbi:MAG TPA: hypothetical protein VIK33_02640 [Anaerolineae bacterium]